MKKKNILLLGLFLLLVAGCSLKKTVISDEKFQEKAQDSGLIVVDVLEQFNVEDELKSATVAASKDSWQVEFYVLESKDAAKNMYEKNKKDFESLEKSKKIQFNNDMHNYSKYTLETKEYYLSLTRVEDTVLYAKVPMEHKNEAKKFIDKLGY